MSNYHNIEEDDPRACLVLFGSDSVEQFAEKFTALVRADKAAS